MLLFYIFRTVRMTSQTFSERIFYSTMKNCSKICTLSPTGIPKNFFPTGSSPAGLFQKSAVWYAIWNVSGMIPAKKWLSAVMEQFIQKDAFLRPLRNFDKVKRELILRLYYDPHHKRLEDAVSGMLEKYGKCLRL